MVSAQEHGTWHAWKGFSWNNYISVFSIEISEGTCKLQRILYITEYSKLLLQHAGKICTWLLVFSPEYAYLTMYLLISTSFAVLVGWYFTKSPSLCSYCLTVIPSIYVLCVGTWKQAVPSILNREHFQLNIQDLCFKLCFLCSHNFTKFLP